MDTRFEFVLNINLNWLVTRKHDQVYKTLNEVNIWIEFGLFQHSIGQVDFKISIDQKLNDLTVWAGEVWGGCCVTALVVVSCCYNQW